MITPQQEKLLESLSVERTVTIIPFDPTAEEKFQKLKAQIQTALGEHVPVVHRGSTMLGISGQNEIDVYIPVLAADFDTLQPALEKLFGKPRAMYPLQRIRFATLIADKHIDLFLINKEHQDWLDGVAFEECCKNNPKVLGAYRQLKEEMNGWTSREFYRRKTEFITSVLQSLK